MGLESLRSAIVSAVAGKRPGTCSNTALRTPIHRAERHATAATGCPCRAVPVRAGTWPDASIRRDRAPTACGEITAHWHRVPARRRSEEHTSELQSLMRISYAVFCLKKKKQNTKPHDNDRQNHRHKSNKPTKYTRKI